MSLWWLLVALACVLFVKWYTSRETQRLVVRISRMKKEHREFQDRKQEAVERFKRAEVEEKQMKMRIEKMKQIILDLKSRLARRQMEGAAAIGRQTDDKAEETPGSAGRKLAGLAMGR